MNVAKIATAVNNLSSAFADPLKRIDLHYMGGEPLIAWNQIQELNRTVANHCAQANIKFTWGMTSNLVALDRRKADVMIAERAGIHCSIDGSARIHDRNRPFRNGKGSFGHVARKIPLALEISPHDTARATICAENAGDLGEIADTILGLGFATVGLFPNYESDWTMDRIAAWAYSIAQVYETSKINGNTRISTMLSPNRKPNKPGEGFGYCGAGKGLWALNPDGKLFHCHHLTNKAEMAIIDASSATSSEIATAISKSWMPPHGKPEPAVCTDCPARSQCNGTCWANNLLARSDSTAPGTTECQLFQATHASLWPLMELDRHRAVEPLSTCGVCYTCQSGRSGECSLCQSSCQTRCVDCENCYNCKPCDSCEKTCEVTCDTLCQVCDVGEGEPYRRP